MHVADSKREEVVEPLLTGVRERIRLAGELLRQNDLRKHRFGASSATAAT